MLMASRSAKILFALVLLVPLSSVLAQQNTGLSWGFTRTYWDGTWYKDGYAEAGTGGNMISLRRELPMSDETRIAVVGSYSWLRHTTTTLLEPVVVDPLSDEVISGGIMDTRTDHTYFREVELALLLNHYVDNEGHSKFYIGGGPSARWGAAGKKTDKINYHDPERVIPLNYVEQGPTQTQAAWFGLSALVGIRQQWRDDSMISFVEPRLLWSPDGSDRYQKTFPPVNFIVAMGVLW
jgi:hypothetical protein